MPRIVAFSPATALSRSSHFDSQQAEWQQSPALKTQQLRWAESPRIKKDVVNVETIPEASDFDQCGLIGAFRFIGSPTIREVFDHEGPDQRWTDQVHELPLETISSYLPMSDLSSVMSVCRPWRRAFSRAPVWRMLYARKSYPQMISRRSHAQSWRSLFLNSDRFSICKLLSLQPDHCFFDMTPPAPCRFSPSAAGEVLGQPRAPIVACLEILPGFYWTALQTATGLVHTGVVTVNDQVVVDRGLDVASRYLAALSPAGWRSLTVRSLTLLLVTLQAIPSSVAVGDALAHAGSFLLKEPFRLVLRFRHGAPSTFYFFARPGPARARSLAILPEYLAEALELDENTSPGDSDCFATLQFCQQTSKLVWTGRYPVRK